MRYRTFGRTGWQVSEVGYGMWGMAGWTGSDDEESFTSLDRAIALGCNFFDTALAYGDGHSERLLGAALKRHPDKRLYVATKIPPKNRKWPARPEYPLDEVFPPDYIREYTEQSLKNIGVSSMDLQQFHVWTDEWAARSELAARVPRLEGRGARARRRHQHQSLAAGERARGARHRADRRGAGRLQRPRSEPRGPALPACQEHDIAVIARVPFDEGSLTGTLTRDSTWPQGDFRNLYFNPENLDATPAARRAAPPLGPCRHDDAAAGAAPHPPAPGRFHGDPGNAEALTRRAEHRRQRRRTPFASADGRAQIAPLGAVGGYRMSHGRHP